MPQLCGASTTRYVGKGKDRQAYSGYCVYDRGHEGLCCPPQLVNTDWVPIPKTEITEAKALVAIAKKNQENDRATPPLYSRLIQLVESWPDPEAFPHV